MKNKLLAFLKNDVIEQNQETVGIISEIIDEYSKNTLYARSGNAVIDSIIEYKFSQVKELGIRFEADIIVPMELECMASDLGIVLGNLLDNAIEAVEQINDRWIYLRMEYTRGRLIVKISNSYIGKLKYVRKQIASTKKDVENHGIGLKSVERVVKKYDGEVELLYDDEKFEVMLLMYLE